MRRWDYNTGLVWFLPYFHSIIDLNFTTVSVSCVRLLQMNFCDLRLSGLRSSRVCMCCYFGTTSWLQHRISPVLIPDAVFHTGVIKSGGLGWHYWSLIGKFILEESADVQIKSWSELIVVVSPLHRFSFVAFLRALYRDNNCFSLDVVSLFLISVTIVLLTVLS